jgi:flagellar motor switch protein FliM
VGSSEQATALQRRRRGETRVYDFRRPVRLARQHAHLIKVAMTTFSRQATTVLTTSLRAVCLIGNSRLEEMSYDQYLTSLPDQSLSVVLSLDPLHGKALLNLDQPTLLAMIDHLLGGPGTTDQPERPLTDIEQALVRHILGRLLRELAYALEPIAAVRPAVLALEGNAQFVQAAAATDPVVVARLDLQIGSRTSAMSLCIPYAMLAPALAALTGDEDAGQAARSRQEATGRVTRRLTDVEVDVAVRFDATRLRSSEIGSLKVGDVLSLGHRTTRPLSVTAATTTFARAVPGVSGRRLAVLIVADS